MSSSPTTLEQLDVRVGTVEGRVNQVERTAASNADGVAAIRAELRSTLWRAAAVVVAAEPVVRELVDHNGPVAAGVALVIAVIALVLFRRNDPPPGSPSAGAVSTP